MKAKLIQIFLMAAVTVFGATEICADWSKYKATATKDGGFRISCGGKKTAWFSGFGGSKPGEAKIENGVLILNVTGKCEEKKYPRFSIRSQKKYPGQNVRLEFDVSGDADGGKVKFFFEGRRSDNKHYYVRKFFTVTKGIQRIVLAGILPEDIKYTDFRFDFMTPGVYRFGNFYFGPAEEKKIDADVNHIPNGGAERGFYGVIPPSPRRFDGLMKVVRDSRIFHSGRHSFRLEGCADSDYNRLVFNSVPFVVGKPLTFSAWMKAEEPSKVDLLLFSSPAHAYVKTFKVGTEWKKYSITIPSFGAKNVPGVRTIGNPADRPPRHINPCITLEKNKKSRVWVDDVACQLNTETTERAPAVYISGRLSEPCGYYRRGNPVAARVKFEPSGSFTSAELEYELADWRGRALLPVHKETVSLPSEKEIRLNVPSFYLGPMNLKIRVKAGGEVLTHNFYCGVISNDRTMNKRLGANVGMRSPEGVRATAELLRDFGIGAVRAWSTSPGVEHVDIFRKSGFYVMLCLAVPHADRKLSSRIRLFMPLDYTEYLADLERRIQKFYRGNVDVYEIFNEPNIWSGRSKNPDESKYAPATPEAVAAGTRKIAECLKKNDPRAQIGGPGCCGTNAAYIGNYLQNGAAEAIQIITEHPYRFLPEQPDYADDLAALKTVVGKREIQSSESGSQTFGSLPDNLIPEYAADCAAKDIRLALVGFANGVSRFYEFSAGGMEVQNAWTIFIGSGPDENNGWQPGIWLYAAKTLAGMIKENAQVSQLKLGFDYRCYIFDDGKERVVALWKWFGKPARLNFSERIGWTDMMGSSFQGKTLLLDHCPVYLRSERSADDLKALILNAMPVSSEEIPVRLSADATGSGTFNVVVKNLTFRTLSGEVRLSSGETKKFSGLQGESTLRLPFCAIKPISVEPQKYEVAAMVGEKIVRQEIELKAILVPSTREKIAIDGDLRDWKQYVSLKLNRRNAVPLVPWDKTALQAEAEVRLTWDAEFFYVAVIATKPGFFPDQHLSPWNGDGIQLAFDTMRNADKNTIRYQDDDFEYAVWQKAEETAVWRICASIAAYDSLPKSIGLTKDVPAAIRNDGDRTVYEMAFPAYSISPFKLFAGSACRFNLILNMSDGRRRIGWLEIAPGIGQSYKKPGEFPDLVLTK